MAEKITETNSPIAFAPHGGTLLKPSDLSAPAAGKP
jgi:hypothetical protein